MKLNISERNTNNFKINKPVLLGTYRTDHQSSPISNDKLNELYLRYRPRSLQRSIDLENGFNDHSKNKRFAVVNKFECLLEWLKVNQHLLQDQTTNSTATGKLNKLNTDFVASNGVLAFLLKSPYDSGNFFELLAERYNGTIYLKMKKKFQKNFDYFDLNNYCEQKFRQHFTEKMDDDFEESKLNQWVSFGKQVIDKEEHDVRDKITFVFRNKIKKHSIVFVDEIDCFEQINPQDKDQFGIVKFKLTKKPEAFEQRNDFFISIRKLRWWSQMVVSSVQRLVVGFWRHDHVVENVETYSLDDLKCSMWCPNVCLNNLNQILSFIKNGFNQLDTNSLCLTHYPYSKELVCVDTNLKVLPKFYKESFGR